MQSKISLFGRRSLRLALVAITSVSCSQAGRADEPSEELVRAMSFAPRQADVNYEKISESDFGDCHIETVRKDGGAGFLVTGPAGQPLRWFGDTNSDNKLDRWSYYNGGVEVYRESDSDGNRKADRYRWLSTEGTRHGIDQDEDGTIDRWQSISPEEVTAEVVAAAATRDPARFARLLISASELKALGLGEAKTDQLSQRAADAAAQFSKWAAGQSIVTGQSRWTNFGADKPGVVPAGTDGSTQDVTVYENVVALIEDNGSNRQLLVGTIVRVGDSWRLVDLPRAITDGAVMSEEGNFFTASFSARGGAGTPSSAGTGISKAMERLVNNLQDIDTRLTSNNPGDLETLHSNRADVLEKLVAESADPADQTTWIRQMADTVNAAAQSGEYEGGVSRLEEFAVKIANTDAAENDIAYVTYRALEAKQQRNMLGATESQYDKIQSQHIAGLKQFANNYPRSPEAADAMTRIALAAEFSGEIDEAKKWYGIASKQLGESLASQKATGALRRLSLEGKPFGIRGTTIDGRQFSSDSYRGAPVIYHCWASWSPQSKTEMAVLKDLQAKYAKQKIRIVGINFDASENDIALRQKFLAGNAYPWVHVSEKDGLDSQLAATYGILTLPMNLIVDSTGKVIRVGVHSVEIDTILDDMLNKK